MVESKDKKLPRLYINGSLQAGDTVTLAEGQAHYVRNVMRHSAGDGLRLFNGVNGEWRAVLAEVGKKAVTATVETQIRPQQNTPDVWVLASPVKKDAFSFMLEKASELGAARFMPVKCDHSVVDKVKPERVIAIATESAEQCERLEVMQVDDLVSLKLILKNWDKTRKIIFCAERQDAPPVLKAVEGLKTPLAVLVGPEGGFSAAEIEKLNALDFVIPVSLGPRILRAETAVCAVLATVVAVLDMA